MSPSFSSPGLGNFLSPSHRARQEPQTRRLEPQEGLWCLRLSGGRVKHQTLRLEERAVLVLAWSCGGLAGERGLATSGLGCPISPLSLV